MKQEPSARSAQRYAIEFMVITGIIFVLYMVLFGGAGRLASEWFGGASPTPVPSVSVPSPSR